MKLFTNKKMPNSEYLSKNGFYVPSGLAISNREIKYVCDVLNKLLNYLNDLKSFTYIHNTGINCTVMLITHSHCVFHYL